MVLSGMILVGKVERKGEEAEIERKRSETEKWGN